MRLYRDKHRYLCIDIIPLALWCWLYQIIKFDIASGIRYFAVSIYISVWVSFCIGAHLKEDAKGHLSCKEAQTFLLQRKRKTSVDVREITVEQFTSQKTYLKWKSGSYNIFEFEMKSCFPKFIYLYVLLCSFIIVMYFHIL